MVPRHATLLTLAVVATLGCRRFEPPVDAGPRDMGEADLGPRDQGVFDLAAPQEAGVVDLGPSDLGVVEPDMPTTSFCERLDEWIVHRCADFEIDPESALRRAPGRSAPSSAGARGELVLRLR